jgi:hypothetical protein
VLNSASPFGARQSAVRGGGNDRVVAVASGWALAILWSRSWSRGTTRRSGGMTLLSVMPAKRARDATVACDHDQERLMGTDDVGARDFRFGVTGVLLMVTAAILLAIFS